MNIVDPAAIEEQLQATWVQLGQEKKVRASTFNLVVFAKQCPRIAYYRTVMQKMIQKFPCRILFITEENTPAPFLQTAISVLNLEDSPGAACEQIDIAASPSSMQQVPFLILPHFLPDLPIYLLWTVNPKEEHPLFASLAKWANRVIFDSESADNLQAFAEKLLSLKEEKRARALQLADLNWARTEPWRNLLAALFDTPKRVRSLYEISHIDLSYNSKETPFFTHITVQSLYLVCWLSSSLGWTFISQKDGKYLFQNKEKKEVAVQLSSRTEEDQKPGAILSCKIKTGDGLEIDAYRAPGQNQRLQIQIASSERCDLPYSFPLGEIQLGQSLVKEIYTQTTSSHFLNTLSQLIQMR